MGTLSRAGTRRAGSRSRERAVGSEGGDALGVRAVPLEEVGQPHPTVEDEQFERVHRLLAAELDPVDDPDVVDNSGDPAGTEAQVDEAFRPLRPVGEPGAG